MMKVKKKRKTRNKRRFKKKFIIMFSLIIVIGLGILGTYLYLDNKKKTELKYQNMAKEISLHYNKYVKTDKETKLYKYSDKKYIAVGEIGKDIELELSDVKVTYNTKYFKIDSFENAYYINYKDISKIEKLTEDNLRYKKYIPYNKNIVTKDKVSFYDENGELVYTLPESLDLPIIVNYDDNYGVEYNNRLLYVKNDSIKEKKDSKNTDLKNTSSIATLNYHFFFDSDDPSDSCNQIICLSTNNLKKHLNYIKDNDIFTPTMREFEMYLDGAIQLPKSVVLTIDDGWRAGIGTKVISEYKLNATLFLMSYYYDPKNYQNEYIEVHSHGHDIHNPGICPGGQGGAIKCMEKSKLLADLKASRDKLNGTTYFCYPFYEYNDYSIQVLKEAGFTMAFGGYMEGGVAKASPGINKFKIPRYVIYSYTTANELASYIK